LPDLHPKLREEYEAAEKRMNNLITAGRERFIRSCTAIQKKCILDIDDAKELWDVGFVCSSIF
jgi:hypothetical protein